MLKSIREVNIGKERHVYYDVERFGDNVQYIKKRESLDIKSIRNS